jgi:hypothetical protein
MVGPSFNSPPLWHVQSTSSAERWLEVRAGVRDTDVDVTLNTYERGPETPTKDKGYVQQKRREDGREKYKKGGRRSEGRERAPW